MDDEKVLQLVQQYLCEKGYQQALDALQQESGMTAEEDMLERGGQLCSILYEHAELKLMLDDSGQTDEEMMDKKRAEEELLQTPPPPSDFPSKQTHSVSTLHSGNIIACRFNCDGTMLASGSADRSVKIASASSREELQSVSDHTAPVLCVDWSPVDKNLLLSTDMGGNALLTDASTGRLVKQFKEHTKYAHRTSWSPDGCYFATCGHDRAVAIYRKADDGDGMAYALHRRQEFVNLPEAMCFLDDGATLVVSLREDNYFHYVDADSGDVSKVNMNPMGDDHVSFAVLDMALSPNGKFLLTSTDRSRLILYSVGTSHQLRTYHGAVNDQLCQTRCCFHPSGSMIYCTSQDQAVYCWGTVSQKVLCKLKGHAAVVRDCHVSSDGSTVISGSFDKTVRFWGA